MQIPHVSFGWDSADLFAYIWISAPVLKLGDRQTDNASFSFPNLCYSIAFPFLISDYALHNLCAELPELHCQQVEGSDPSFCLSIGEAAPGVLCPVLHSLA